MTPDCTFTPGKQPGQWQTLDGAFVLRCPRCTNRFSVQPFQTVVEDAALPTTWQLKCPHRCGWRSMVAALIGAAPDRLRLLTDISEGHRGRHSE